MRSLIPDLYDRFAAPIEERYSEAGARTLVEQAGCIVRSVAYIRGWAVWERRRARRDAGHALTIASACHAAAAANAATSAKTGHGMAGATVRGIRLISSGCALAAISIATAIVLITSGFGIARSSPAIDRAAPPVIDVRHADPAALTE